MRIMYDSVTPRNILNHTKTPTMVAGYANGRYKWSDADWALFPNTVKVRIAVRASYLDAHVLDCEVGDATPEECPLWAQERRARGGEPIIYCNRTTWALVRLAFQNKRVELPMFWIATASGRAEYPAGSIGAQYLLDWQGVDVSAMADYIPGIDQDPFVPGTGEDEDMSVVGKAFTGTPANPLEYVTVPCDGKRRFFCAVGGNNYVKGHLYFIGDTPSNSNKGNYTGDTEIYFAADRPGPVTVPPNTRVVAFWYSDAKHDFTAWCA